MATSCQRNSPRRQEEGSSPATARRRPQWPPPPPSLPGVSVSALDITQRRCADIGHVTWPALAVMPPEPVHEAAGANDQHELDGAGDVPGVISGGGASGGEGARPV